MLGAKEDKEDKETYMLVQTIRKSKGFDINDTNVQKYHVVVINSKDLDEEIKKIRNE